MAEFETTATVEFKVICKCGDDLDYNETSDAYGNHVLEVFPCGECLNEARDEGYSQCEKDNNL